MSSPVAVRLVVATYSVSSRAPKRRVLLIVLDALAKLLKSPKSVVGAAMVVT